MGSISRAAAVLVPIAPTPYPDASLHLDTDDPNYLVGDAALYLTLALAFDALAAPGCVTGRDGVTAPDYARLQPRLATSWRAEGDRDWVVTLRPARSHAGHELTAEDIAWRFAKCFGTPQTLGSWRWGASVGLDGVDVLSEREVRFRLRSRLEHFPNWLFSVTPNVVDAQEIRRHTSVADPWGIAWTNEHVAGFGPYNCTGADADSLVFTPRIDHWQGDPGRHPVALTRVPTRADAYALLDSPAPAVLLGPIPDELASLVRRDDLTVHRTWAGHLSVEIDFTTEPFDDIRVRQALARAVPYDRIVSEGLLGFGRPWRSPVKATSQWYEPGFWSFDRDLDRARELLRAAGHAGLATTLHVPERPDCERIGGILRDAWREIGIEVEVRWLGELARGVNPPLRLRTECGHNLSEPIYDLIHDHAVLDPVIGEPSGSGIGHWHPLWKQNETALSLLRATMLEDDPRRKRSRFMELQAYLVAFSSSIFLAENVQAMICTESVPPELTSPDRRFFQALQYQNAGSVYLPAR